MSSSAKHVLDESLNYRDPDTVMRLNRMGSSHQCRLSFMRTLLRRLKREAWTFDRTVWEINSRGFGRAVYQAAGPHRTYSLIIFSHDLPDDKRSDRVIAEAWDATFTLFDGVPTEIDLQRLEQNVPKQEAGRISSSEICLSRANCSMRMFDGVIDALANGDQPDQEKVEQVGYLMRTTAVYGSGKFGAADRDMIKERPELEGPFQAEMLSVWLIRAFTLDLVEHIAAAKGGADAVVLEPELRRCFGVGNSTGLGMAPFVINHPTLLNNWIVARETALARVRSLEQVDAEKYHSFCDYVKRAALNADRWHSEHPIQKPKIAALRTDFQKIFDYLVKFNYKTPNAWNVLYCWAQEELSLEGCEQIAMLMMEPYPELVDDLTSEMGVDESNLFLIDGNMSVKSLCDILEENYDWALATDFTERDNKSRFWYVSEEKLEPRLGERFAEPGKELEQPLCISWQISDLYRQLQQWSASASVKEFLFKHPECRYIVRRAQQIQRFPYMEVRDNLISAGMLPIDLLRLKLSFFGANKFDPRSDRWVRINMFQYAPFPHELASMSEEEWVYPLIKN